MYVCMYVTYIYFGMCAEFKKMEEIAELLRKTERNKRKNTKI